MRDPSERKEVAERVAREARATWDSSPSIRAEFIEFDHYKAFVVGTALGDIRVAGGPKAVIRVPSGD